MEVPNKPRGEHYNLRWNSYTNNLIQVLLEHQHHENLVDVTLWCEGQFIKAHKLVLSACSEVFQEMFKFHSAQNPVIILTGIKFNHFKHILEFIYQGEVKVLDADLEGVLALGKNLKVKGLSSIKFKHQVQSEELESPALKHCSSPIESMPNSLSNTSGTSSQTFVNSSSNKNQQKVKEFYPNVQPQKKAEMNLGFKRRLHSAEHIHSSLNEVQSNNTNLNNESIRNVSKLETVLTHPKEVIRRRKFVEKHSPTVSDSGSLDTKAKENCKESDKNSRPTNAFMIFANEWRKKVAVEHPDENNKEISVRLGDMWKSLSNDSKQSYYMAARKAELEHKVDHPTRHTIKNEQPKKRKLTRRKTIDSISHLVSVNLQEFDDDDDLQIIEVNEDPIDVTNLPPKRNQNGKRPNNT